MADIFVSYTSSDRDWAFWIGQELEKLGHVPRIHEWEIPAGGNIPAWMEERHQEADYILCVISKAYLDAPYSSWERQAAQWASATSRPNFAIPVFVDDCEAPTMFAHVKRCDLHGISDQEAHARLEAFMAPAAKPVAPVPFPGAPRSLSNSAKIPVAFPGRSYALSNIPIMIPRHFFGRDNAFAAITAAFAQIERRIAIAALYGMRGVGKTTLAAAYAERHRGDYRATWWIRAQTETGIRADLVALGVRFGWIAANEKEESALVEVMERLRHEGDDFLLIFDNAIGVNALKPYLPRGGTARILVTSNAHAWREIATPIEISIWPSEIGADYLIARTGKNGERNVAIALSAALGGLPLAHEQAAAYCERLVVSLLEYHKRFQDAPGRLLDDTRDAPVEYYGGLTVARTFALAIEEASKLHPAAEPLISYAALLPPEPIPIFLFAEGREKFGKPFALALADDGLDEAIATLHAFALIDREIIVDERDSSITTDTIRLHRLVRQVAIARCDGQNSTNTTIALLKALEIVYPEDVFINPETWPLARRLDALVLAIVDDVSRIPEDAYAEAGSLLNGLASYRQEALAAYAEALPLFESALAVRNIAFGAEHRETVQGLINLAGLHISWKRVERAQPLLERALAICERARGPDDVQTAACLSNLAAVFHSKSELGVARPLIERALDIHEKVFGPNDSTTVGSRNNLGVLLWSEGDYTKAQSLVERALEISEKHLGSTHPETARSLALLAGLLVEKGDREMARPLYERALKIREKIFGSEHPGTIENLHALAKLLRAQGSLGEALPMFERVLAIRERSLGLNHESTKECASAMADLLDNINRSEDAVTLRARYGIARNSR